MRDQWLELRRQLLIRRDKCDATKGTPNKTLSLPITYPISVVVVTGVFVCADAVVAIVGAVVVLIKLHITAQPDPVIPIFQGYRYGSVLWGISG